MGSRRIKGITIEIGGDTTKLDKALKATDTQLNKTKYDLKDVERLLKLDPGNVELLAQKQRLLTDAVEGTADRLRVLENAAQQANEQLSRGEITQQSYDALRREIIETSKKFEELNKTAADFDIDEAVKDAEHALNGLGNTADDTNEKMGGLSGVFSGAADKLGLMDIAAGGAAFTIGQKLVEAAMAAVDWIWSLDEATEEYREAMGKLNTAFETAGYGPEAAMEAYEGFYKILGDTDTATEASQLLANMANREEDLAYLTNLLTDEYGVFANNIPVDTLIQAAVEAARTGEVTGTLAEEIERAGGSAESLEEKLKSLESGNADGLVKLKLVSDELSGALFEDAELAEKASNAFYELGIKTDSLSTWTDIAAGVYATFGDSLPIEGLIEAANETAKTGKVTGVLADALNWVGMSEDAFNESLQWQVDEGDRARLIMNNLAIAYGDAADKFYENNEALIETRENEAQMDSLQAQLGESVAHLKSQFFDLFSPALIVAIQSVTGVIWAIQIAVNAIGEVLDWLGQKVKDVIGFFQELFGVSKQASNVSVGGAGANSRALAEPYALRAASAENLPYLAQGTVTRPNSPFMAVIGDNPQEPEIVSPLSTIEQAVRNVMGEGGGQASNIRVSVNFTGTLAQFVRDLQPLITVENQRRGPQYVT